MHKTLGRPARLYFLFCEKVTKEFLARSRPSAEKAAIERLKACDSFKMLSEEIRFASPELTGRDYGSIHGMTNKACTSKTKGEWAREWGVEAKKLNLRTHMTPEALSQVDALQMATAAYLRNNPNADPLEVHARKCAAAHALLEGVDTVTREPQTSVRSARTRLEPLAIAAPPPPPPAAPAVVNTINNYFAAQERPSNT